jgi:hypothetical protein
MALTTCGIGLDGRCSGNEMSRMWMTVTRRHIPDLADIFLCSGKKASSRSSINRAIQQATHLKAMPESDDAGVSLSAPGLRLPSPRKFPEPRPDQSTVLAPH